MKQIQFIITENKEIKCYGTDIDLREICIAIGTGLKALIDQTDKKLIIPAMQEVIHAYCGKAEIKEAIIKESVEQNVKTR